MASIFMKAMVGLNLAGIFFLFVVLRISDLENVSNIRRYSTGGGENSAAVKRTNVVILSQGRGGSTFLGEFFNSNPEIFYIFEPLHLLGSLLNLNVFYEQETREYGQTCLAVLRSFLSCDFSNQATVLDALSAQRGLRSKSNALSGNELCSERKLEKSLKTRKHCQKLSTINVNRVCEGKKHSVIKVLLNRLPNKTMASLKELLTGNYDIKIVHLVRDPRPVVYSWVKNAWIKGTEDPKLVDNVHRICNPMYENILLGQSQHGTGWLQGRYKLVRYEELAVNPLKMAREIYDFVGFPWAPEVEKWIYLTNVAAKSGSPKNPYSTIRNGSVEVTRWVTEAPKKLVHIVEKVCGNLMAKVGYKKVTR